MKQHVMTHKLRGDPGYEDGMESQEATSPEGSSPLVTVRSPKEEDEVDRRSVGTLSLEENEPSDLSVGTRMSTPTSQHEVIQQPGKDKRSSRQPDTRSLV